MHSLTRYYRPAVTPAGVLICLLLLLALGHFRARAQRMIFDYVYR